MVTLIAPRKIVATATASATLARGAHTPVDATSGAKTMTLPANAPAGVEISVEKVDASTNTVTVSGTLRGVASSITLATQYEARTFLSDGAGSWRPTSDHRTTASLNRTFLKRALLANPAPYFPNDRIVTTGASCIGVDEVAGISFWSNTTTIFLSTDGGATMTADPGANLGKPPGVTGVFKVQSMMRQGSQAFWWCIGLDAASNTPTLYRTPVVTPGTAMTWTAMKAGLTGATVASFGLGISADGQTICWGDYYLPSSTSCKIHRSTDGGATWSDVYTISATSKHFHDVKPDPYTPNRWLSTAGDGPSATSADYLLVSTDNGATWTSKTQTEFHRNFQSVCISFGASDDPYIYLAPDVTYTDLVMLDRTTLTPYASVSDHNKQAVPNPGTWYDGKSTSGSATYTTFLSACFQADDVGRRITGTNIPAGTTILTYNSTQSVTLSANATATSTAGTLRFTIERPERWNMNNYFGKVDPATGIYYFLTNDDANAPGGGFPRYGLFALLPGATAPVLLDFIPGNGFGIWLDNALKRIYVGQISRPLLQSAS